MKKTIIIATFLCMFGNASIAMEKSSRDRLHDLTEKKIDLLRQEIILHGDANSSMAMTDFYKNVKDPEYRIYLSSSIKILKDLGLLDSEGNVHQAIRKAYEQYKKAE